MIQYNVYTHCTLLNNIKVHHWITTKCVFIFSVANTLFKSIITAWNTKQKISLQPPAAAATFYNLNWYPREVSVHNHAWIYALMAWQSMWHQSLSWPQMQQLENLTDRKLTVTYLHVSCTMYIIHHITYAHHITTCMIQHVHTCMWPPYKVHGALCPWHGLAVAVTHAQQ